MEKLAVREGEVFEALGRMRNIPFVLIGGYAVNAYALPRFSVDCDILIREKEAKGVQKQLLRLGYSAVRIGKAEAPYGKRFLRYEKAVLGLKVSFDIMIGSVYDRGSGADFSADWVFLHSKNRELAGKTIAGRVAARIIDIAALFVMKFVSARGSDVRDVFMIADKVSDWKWAKDEISKRIDYGKRAGEIKKKIADAEFKKNLEGVWGFVEKEAFEKRKGLIAGMPE